MAKNDKILIDGIIDDRIEIKLPSIKRDEAFEYFAIEQDLKDYDLSRDEIIAGNIDGRNDGGIDGFYIIVNGHLLSDPESFQWPKAGSVLEVWIITCKHHDKFKQAPLDNIAASVAELLDFTIDKADLKGDYSEQVLSSRENLKYAYRKVSSRLSNFIITYVYASRGNTVELGESIESRSKQIIKITEDSFGNCVSNFIFLGSSELIELHRKVPNFTLELPFVEDLSRGERYVMLVNLFDYFNFISDNGKLRRYLFDSNVRDFMGLNRVNEDIKATLLDIESPDFWLLNNGVTILATGASVIGKSIQIEDIQIVNGLQTSESIYRHFIEGGSDPKNRSVLVKVIVSQEDNVRDTIIRATNNQTNVELASLHATDKIQRDIEDILKQHDLYYERRTNFYKNQEISTDKILTPLYIAAGFLSLVLKNADHATRLKSKFMRSESSYEKVFSLSTDLKIWPQIAKILKKTDSFIESVRPKEKKGNDRVIKARRQFLSFITVSRLLGTFDFSAPSLISLDIDRYNEDELFLMWEFMNSLTPDDRIRYHIGRNYFVSLCENSHEKWGIKGINRIKNNNSSEIKYVKTKKIISVPNKLIVDKEFALKIDALLPEQPWKPGIHREIVKNLNCTNANYFEAVKILIDEGIRFHQKDGVVYDYDGNVMCFDDDRVDIDTLKLKK
jgi:hypothetical protein